VRIGGRSGGRRRGGLSVSASFSAELPGRGAKPRQPLMTAAGSSVRLAGFRVGPFVLQNA